MKKRNNRTSKILQGLLAAIFVITNVEIALAHCDTLDGPVVADARTALATENVYPVLKWVSSEDEEQIITAFKRTLAVRSQGDEAKNLADTYFYETLVRIHRTGEGAPYSGLKPGTSIDPAVALADDAIVNKSVEELANILSNALNAKLVKQFSEVTNLKQHLNEGVEEGREYVQAYVEFTHFTEGIHGLIKGDGHHSEQE